MTGTAPYLVCKGRHPHQRRYGKSVSAHPEHRRHIRKQRKESCGSHYRKDSPDTDDAHYLHRISIGLEEKIKKRQPLHNFSLVKRLPFQTSEHLLYDANIILKIILLNNHSFFLFVNAR